MRTALGFALSALASTATVSMVADAEYAGNEPVIEWMADAETDFSMKATEPAYRYPTWANSCKTLQTILDRQGYIDLAVRFMGLSKRNYLTPNNYACVRTVTKKARWTQSTVSAKDGACYLGYTCVRHHRRHRPNRVRDN